jgi:LCP family protein required for cell wall assembly
MRKGQSMNFNSSYQDDSTDKSQPSESFNQDQQDRLSMNGSQDFPKRNPVPSLTQFTKHSNPELRLLLRRCWYRRKRCLAILLLLCVVGGFIVVTLQKALAFGSAISPQMPLSSQTNYMGTNVRVNILVMSYSADNHDELYLTDSMVVLSLLPQSHHTTLISVPRDLWVQVPDGSSHYQRVNSVYAVGSHNNADRLKGGNAAARSISLITGLDVQYWLTINFEGFRNFIDAIGGIDVNVPDSFSANYPRNDDPNVDPNWITVHFFKGIQHMNGEMAIRYARVRYVFDNNAEGNDFARSVRQKIILKAALSKVEQISTWPSLYNRLNELQNAIYTNLSLADLVLFVLKLDLGNAYSVGLSDQNVLRDSTSDDGQYILIPRNNDWQAIVNYVKRKLYN